MKKVSNNGFGVIEILLIFTLIACVGLGGYYVYNQNEKKESNTTAQPVVKPTIPASWETTTYTTGGFNISHPNGWNVTKEKDNELIITSPVFDTTFAGTAYTKGVLSIRLHQPNSSSENGSQTSEFVEAQVLKVTSLSSGLKLVETGGGISGEPVQDVLVNDDKDVMPSKNVQVKQFFTLNGKNTAISIRVSPPKQTVDTTVTPETLNNLEEFQTAVDILKTIH